MIDKMRKNIKKTLIIIRRNSLSAQAGHKDQALSMIRANLKILTVVFGVLGTQVAMAQVALFDAPLVLSKCGRGECQNAIISAVNEIQRQNLPEAEFNSQLGILAAVLFEAARGADDETARRISLAITILAEYSTDQAQRRPFLWVADMIVNGDNELFDLDDPFAVSPS